MIAKEKIKELVKEELEEAKKKHGEYLNTTHEKFAVLMEEVDEALDETDEIESCMKYMWECVKNDQSIDFHIKKIRESAIKAIQELIQVIAMCDKEVNI